MTRYVLTPDVVTHLAERNARVSTEHQLLAPTLLRSQLLSHLYRAQRRGEITTKDAEERLDYMRSLKLRFLGDRVLQRVAWRIATDLDRPDTWDAEYVALTHLQADALVTLDEELAATARQRVVVAGVDELLASGPS